MSHKPAAELQSINTIQMADITGSSSRETEPASPKEKRVILREEECYEQLGFGFPTWRKWLTLTVIFLVQVSMNFNTSLYSNALGGISAEFGVDEQAARCGAMIFLVTVWPRYTHISIKHA